LRPQSAKAKGRRLQQEIRDQILAAFPELEPDDVRSTSMGASGSDILLSPKARRFFPYYVEAKNVESLNIHKAIEQARAGTAKYIAPDGSQQTPVVVFRKNSTPPYVAVPFDHFMELVGIQAWYANNQK
jgi:hypothetical protein